MDNPEYIENDLVFGLGIDMVVKNIAKKISKKITKKAPSGTRTRASPVQYSHRSIREKALVLYKKRHKIRKVQPDIPKKLDSADEYFATKEWKKSFNFPSKRIEKIKQKRRVMKKQKIGPKEVRNAKEYIGKVESGGDIATGIHLRNVMNTGDIATVNAWAFRGSKLSDAAKKRMARASLDRAKRYNTSPILTGIIRHTRLPSTEPTVKLGRGAGGVFEVKNSRWWRI